MVGICHPTQFIFYRDKKPNKNQNWKPSALLGGEEQLTSYPSPRYCVYLFRHITYSLCRTVTHPDRLLNCSTIQGDIQGNYLPNKDCNYWLTKNTSSYNSRNGYDWNRTNVTHDLCLGSIALFQLTLQALPLSYISK